VIIEDGWEIQKRVKKLGKIIAIAMGILPLLCLITRGLTGGFHKWDTPK